MAEAQTLEVTGRSGEKEGGFSACLLQGNFISTAGQMPQDVFVSCRVDSVV